MNTNSQNGFYYIVDIIQKIATIGSLAFVAYQAWILKKDYRIKNEKAECDKAIELSRFYSEKILPRISYLFTVFNSSGISNILANIKYTDITEFDQTELNEVIGESKVKEITRIISNLDVGILAEASHYVRTISYDEYADHIRLLFSEKPKKAKGKAKEEVAAAVDVTQLINNIVDQNKVSYVKKKLYDEYAAEQVNTLNLLEYFCMNFNSGIADEETVYQSLHQSFLGIVKLLYFYIAQNNISGKDKYYTNIIKLYNKWSERYNEQQEIEKVSQRFSVHEKRKIKK